MIDESALASGIYQNLSKCLALRNKYYELSLQAERDKMTDEQYGAEAVAESGSEFSGAVPTFTDELTFELNNESVYIVSDETGKAIVRPPPLRDYYMDCDYVSVVVTDGPTKTLAFRRLRYLQAQFQIYLMLNEQKEWEEQRQASHRDFYNVRKVDTHIHHSSCMNCKHLLRFIKSKLKRCPNDIVIYRDGKHLTLQDVFKSLNLTAYDLSIDVFDMHAHKDSFHRFDRFNLKYNPIGEGRLREIFLKTDNHVKGKYLAELTQEVMDDLRETKYQHAEWRLSIYGHSKGEWDKLAAWVVDNNLYSEHVRWLIQIPRLFEMFCQRGSVKTFAEMIQNIFEPLFEVTRDPSSHPKLHHFLKRVVGFDCVDDESKTERREHRKYPLPHEWNQARNPPYSYYAYFLYANITSLNHFRQRRGLKTFVFRPHCGEAGDPDHLVNAFLLSHGINHGITMRKLPALQYLYYLSQIGIAMSPLGNNILFLTYDRNPFMYYFQCGMNVSLSTDDPLQFHYTREPLIEEYSVAAQIYKMSAADMCEIARNSVLQSGFEAYAKRQWLGPDFWRDGAAGNECVKTNVPSRRIIFRWALLQRERCMVRGEDGNGEGSPTGDEMIRPSQPTIEQVILAEIEEGIIIPEVPGGQSSDMQRSLE